MSGATYSDVQTWGGMKELYDEDARMQENVMSSLYEFMTKAGESEVDFDGANWNVQVQLALNANYAGLNDDEHLPESRVPKGVWAKFAAKKNYSTVEATTFAATRGHKGGRVDGKYLDSMVKGTLLNFTANMDFDCYGNGRGYRATIVTATPGAASFVPDTTMQLMPNACYDWYDSTYATKRGSIAIDVKSIDRMNKIAYIDSTFGTGAVPAGAVAGDVLVVYGALNPSEPTDGRFVCGLGRATDNTLALGGLNPSTYAAWMATNINATLGNPSQTQLQLFWDCMYQISRQYPNRFAFNSAFKRGYLAQFLNQRRFTSNSFDTGASSLTFSPLKMGTDEKGKKPPEFLMLEDKNCPPSKVYLWSSESVKIATDYSEAPHLADEDEREFRFRLGYDAMQGFFRFWWNIVYYQRNAVGTIYNLNVPSTTL